MRPREACVLQERCQSVDAPANPPAVERAANDEIEKTGQAHAQTSWLRQCAPVNLQLQLHRAFRVDKR
eukprot:31911-Pyramimonas_sp.AAC.1